MSDFYIGAGDTASPLADVLRDAAGDPVNLTGAQVRLRLVPLRGGAALVDNETADIDAAVDGEVHRDWQTGETDVAGDYLGQWLVTYSGGAVQTFPNDGYLLVTITADPDLQPGRYLTLEELKRTLKLEGKTHGDRDLEVAIAAAAAGLETEYNRGQAWTLGAPAEARYFTPVHARTVLDLRQIQDVDAVAIDSAGGGTYSTALVDGTDYRLERKGAPTAAPPWDSLRLLRSGFAWAWSYNPVTDPYPWGVDSLRITGRWGWTETPPGVKEASTIIATRLFRRAREAPFGIIGMGLEGVAIRAGQLARDPEVIFAMKEPKASRRLVV